MASVLTWRALAPSDGDFQIVQFRTYAAAVSIASDRSLASVVTYLLAHGWSQVVGVEASAAPETLPTDPDASHRVIYIQATRTGASGSYSQSMSLLLFYRILQAWELVTVDTPDPPPPPARHYGRAVAVGVVLAAGALAWAWRRS